MRALEADRWRTVAAGHPYLTLIPEIGPPEPGGCSWLPFGLASPSDPALDSRAAGARLSPGGCRWGPKAVAVGRTGRGRCGCRGCNPLFKYRVLFSR